MIVVGIGSNLSDKAGRNPLDICQWAVQQLSLHKHIKVTGVSSWYKTEPVPVSTQPWYVNGAVRIQTTLSPQELLAFLHVIEEEAGRTRTYRNEARVLDLDLICYNHTVLNDDGLVIPHPRLQERAFVLNPMNEIAEGWVHPILKKTVGEMQKANVQQVEKICLP